VDPKRAQRLDDARIAIRDGAAPCEACPVRLPPRGTIGPLQGFSAKLEETARAKGEFPLQLYLFGQARNQA
jgi:hypothetical protein